MLERDNAQASQSASGGPERAAQGSAPGSGVEKVCPSCKAENPSDSAFCRDCGARLLEEASVARVPDAAAPAVPPAAATLMVQSRPGVVDPLDAAPSGTLVSDGGNQLQHEPPVQAHQQRATSPETADHRPSLDRRAVQPASSAAHNGGEAPAAAAPAPQGALRGAEAKVCKACGALNGPNARFCQICGLGLEGGSGERPRSRPPALDEPMPQAELVVIAQDGSPGRRYPLGGPTTTIGSRDTDICLRKDPYVSPEHAELRFRGGRFTVEDTGSLNGVYVRLGGSVPLQSGDRLLLGLGVLRFEAVDDGERNLTPRTKQGVRVFGTPPAPRYGRLTLQTVEEKPRDVYYLSRAETVLGREVGDIVFTDDPFMSRRHAAIRRDPNTNHFTLRDLGSSNGSFIAIRDSHPLSPGDYVRIGQHLFRLDVRGQR